MQGIRCPVQFMTWNRCFSYLAAKVGMAWETQIISVICKRKTGTQEFHLSVITYDQVITQVVSGNMGMFEYANSSKSGMLATLWKPSKCKMLNATRYSSLCSTKKILWKKYIVWWCQKGQYHDACKWENLSEFPKSATFWPVLNRLTLQPSFSLNN